jgi:hypothetical protein
MFKKFIFNVHLDFVEIIHWNKNKRKNLYNYIKISLKKNEAKQLIFSIFEINILFVLPSLYFQGIIFIDFNRRFLFLFFVFIH